MQDNGLKRADLATRLGVSPQYVSKLLSGTENLSFKSVANIEDKLGITCFALSWYVYNMELANSYIGNINSDFWRNLCVEKGMLLHYKKRRAILPKKDGMPNI